MMVVSITILVGLQIQLEYIMDEHELFMKKANCVSLCDIIYYNCVGEYESCFDLCKRIETRPNWVVTSYKYILNISG